MKARSKVQIIKATSEEMPALGNLIPTGAREGQVFLFHERQSDDHIGSVALVIMAHQERQTMQPKGPRGPVIPIISAPPPPMPVLVADPTTQALGSLVVELLERVGALEAERDARSQRVEVAN